MSREIKIITEKNTTKFDYIGSAFKIHTDMEIKKGDVLGLPSRGKISNEEVVEIRDLLTDEDRHHGDILNQHNYRLITRIV